MPCYTICKNRFPRFPQVFPQKLLKTRLKMLKIGCFEGYFSAPTPVEEWECPKLICVQKINRQLTPLDSSFTKRRIPAKI